MCKRYRLQSRARIERGTRLFNIEREIADINRKLKRSVDDEMEREERRTVDVTEVNPKHFYSYAKKINKTGPLVEPLLNNGEFISGTEEIARELGTNNSKIYTVPRYSDPSAAVARWSGSNRKKTLGKVEFSEADMKTSMLKLSENSAPEPDDGMVCPPCF